MSRLPDEINPLIQITIRLPESYVKEIDIWTEAQRAERATFLANMIKHRVDANKEVISDLVGGLAAEHGVSVAEMRDLLYRQSQSKGRGKRKQGK